jgi:pyruvate/2-oxoglutarate dehydrogenase complex dihydrolipoamide dehydrogenase (E3) component
VRYDAIIIGSGQAGNPLSSALTERGWSVALIEKSYLGGTCINTGCTPTKTMIASGQVAHYPRNGKKWGVSTSGVSVDLPAIVARKNAVVHSFRDGQQRRVDKYPKLRFRSEIEKERATLPQENHPSSKLPRWASFSTPTGLITSYLSLRLMVVSGFLNSNPGK